MAETVERACPRYVIIVAQRDWSEANAPPFKHPEAKRNEVFLMNVTPVEFAWFRTIHMQDFKRVRLGDKALTLDNKPVNNMRPMFGALRRGARLRRKANKKCKKK